MVYITSDLFGGASTYDHSDISTSTEYTSMAGSPHSAGLGKRKRLQGDEGPNTHCMHQHRTSPSSRAYARLQNHNASSLDNRNLSYSSFLGTPIFSTSERRPVKQMKRLGPKAPLVKSTSHLMDVDLDLPPPKAETHPHAVADLRSCHACKSAPKRKKDLENYLDCRRCVERTCYICARQCYGGCGKAVCKKCIVEVGEEGDPWCLDCYARNLNS